MHYPNFNEEKKLWKKGYDFVIGIDEVGRGPLAASVVAVAVVIKNFQFPTSNFQSIFNFQFSKIKDSKKLTAKQREEIYEFLKVCPSIKWGIGRVSEKVIDKINILEATKLAMNRAVKNLEKKFLYFSDLAEDRARSNWPRTGLGQTSRFLLIDGNFRINTNILQKSIIKGDEKVFSCACASIIAKVTRDKMMINYHKKYPQYGFDRHKGYPTKLHKEMIKKYGFCKIHRKTFKIC